MLIQKPIAIYPSATCCLISKQWSTRVPVAIESWVPKERWKSFIDELNDLEAQLCSIGCSLIMICSCLCAPYALCQMPKDYMRISLLEEACVVRWNALLKQELNIKRDFMFFCFDSTCRTILIKPSKFYPIPSKMLNSSLRDQNVDTNRNDERKLPEQKNSIEMVVRNRGNCIR